MRIRRNPDLYHGTNNMKNFFEGWYFKLVSPDQKEVFAFIPGISFGKKPEHSHSFLQIVDGSRCTYDYLMYPPEQFAAEKSAFKLNVHKCSFSRQGITLDTDTIQGSIKFTNIKPWPDSIINPGSMGFYNYIPNMQCYSQVCSLDFDLEGSITLKGKELSFTGGKGYIEKNWGKAFPYSWIWVQANNFPNIIASLSCSLGHIPFGFTSFRGFLIGFLLDNEFYNFSTNNLSTIIVQQEGEDVRITAQNRKYILTFETHAPRDKFILLNGPRDGKMIPLVQENLQGTVTLKLTDKKNNLIYQGTSNSAGIEYGGKQMLVLDNGI